MAQTASILGLGLMGGSLGLALKARGWDGRVAAYARRRETREKALRLGAADEVFDRPEDAVRGASVVVVCAPVLTIPDLVRRCAPCLGQGCAVTDVGSTKAWVVGACREALAGTGAKFVGSHPVAGSERAGLEAARADLYEGSITVVTRDGADDAATARVADLWTAAGSRVVRLEADEHDRILARTSHLPHLAAALVALAAARGEAEEIAALRRLVGPGFRDTTRVAGGSPDVWHDIVRTNAAPILAELDALGAGLARLRAAVASGDFDRVREMLAGAAEARERLVPPRDGAGAEAGQGDV